MDVEIACVCGHHETDTVALRETLDFRSAVAIRNAVQLIKSQGGEASSAEIGATLAEQYVLFGVESWSLRDDKGKPIPVTRETIREHLLPHVDPALVVAEAADDLYTKAVVLPLLLRASKSSPPTPTAVSTSAKNAGRKTRPKRSSPSSTGNTPTDGIATITASPAGDSS